MLDNSDKKWIEETIDEKLEVKLDAKLEEKLEAKLEEKLEEKLETKFEEKFHAFGDTLRKDLNETMDLRFADFMETVDRRIDERLSRSERRFELIVENKLIPMLKIHTEVLPGAYKSYGELEERVEALELNYDVLKNVMSSRL